MSRKNSGLYAGIDLGGTKIYAIIIDGSGRKLSSAKVKTERGSGIAGVLKDMLLCLKKAAKKKKLRFGALKAIGVAVPSAVDVTRGLLINAPNLGWKNVELARWFALKTGKPVFIDNDANMGVYGEYSVMPRRKPVHLYGIFAGTGVGGGLIHHGELVRGLNYTAGEIGHMIIKMGGPQCNCGRKGCLEAIAGKVGIVNYMRKLTSGRKARTMLDRISPGWKNGVGSSALRKCWERGDKPVRKALKRAARALGVACANLINVSGLDAIVLGGGMIEEMGPALLPIIKKHMNLYSMAGGAKNVSLSVSRLGDDAVAAGAALFVSDKKNQKLLIKPFGRRKK